jgi:hypothetical protein
MISVRNVGTGRRRLREEAAGAGAAGGERWRRKESEDGGRRMEKRGNKAARRDWTQTDCRAAIRQVGWLQHALVTPQRSDGAITPCRVHAAFAISATVIDRRYRRSIRHQHEPSR